MADPRSRALRKQGAKNGSGKIHPPPHVTLRGTGADAISVREPCHPQAGAMIDRARIDNWLWHARFFRSRVLAQAAARSGLVRLNGVRVEKAGHGVRPGDVLTLPQGPEVLAVRVVAIASRRGPAKAAKALYEIVAGRNLDREP